MLRFIRRRNKKDTPAETKAAAISPADAGLPEAEAIQNSTPALALNPVTESASHNNTASNNQVNTDATNSSDTTPGTVVKPESPVTDERSEQTGFMKRLANKISKTSSSLGDGLGQLLLGKKEIDDELLEDIETQLLMADVGIETTQKIGANLAASIERDALTDSSALYALLKLELKSALGGSDQEFVIDTNRAPYVILVVGVNGAGKTTTIGKLAKRLQNNGLKVMLAAGDTFRAAAVEQLEVWGERNNVPVVAQHTGADSASVIYDALESAKARDVDVLIADTAGRLHNKEHLMEELKKIVRVMGKIDASAPHETLLVLDATTGQNAIAQAQKFQQLIGVTGIAVTKLDGTAKGGVVFAIKEQLGLPIRFIGVGEKIEDLRPFEPEEFVDAIFANDK